VDDITAPSPIDISVNNVNGIKVLNGIEKGYNHLNDLKVLDSIKSHKLLNVVTGNAINQKIDDQESSFRKKIYALPHRREVMLKSARLIKL